MSAMKVLCAAIAAIAVICFIMPTSYQASAEDSAYAGNSYAVYARADVTNAYICSEADSTTALFAVPYSYCVRILSEYGMWFYVSYAEDTGTYKKVYGYVLQSRLTVIDEVPPTEWLYYTLTVTFSQGSSGYLPTLNDITATAAFYGNYYSGQSGYSYVLCQGSFGYITGPTEDYEIVEYTSSDEEQSSDSGQGTADGKVIAAVVLCLLAVITIVVLFLSGRRPRYRKNGD